VKCHSEQRQWRWIPEQGLPESTESAVKFLDLFNKLYNLSKNSYTTIWNTLIELINKEDLCKKNPKTLHWRKLSKCFCSSAGGSNKLCFFKLNIKLHGFCFFCSDFSTSVNNIQINKTKPQWHNYFLCGLKGIQVSQIHLTYEI